MNSILEYFTNLFETVKIEAIDELHFTMPVDRTARRHFNSKFKFFIIS